MSTNFYWRTNACPTCGHGDELHVGKSGPSFQGHFTPNDDGEMEPLIVSWAQWKERLRSGVGKLWDEYGVREDVEEFIARIEGVDPELRRRQYDWCANPRHWLTPESANYVGRVGPRCNWLDADGFSFYGGEFS